MFEDIAESTPLFCADPSCPVHLGWSSEGIEFQSDILTVRIQLYRN